MLEKIYKEMLLAFNEDVNREGLLKTPKRAAKAMEYLVSGYNKDINKIVNGALFEVDCDDVVVIKNIEFYSLCEHHILPFWGTCSVGYIPNGKVIGLSKIPRIVDMYSRRLQVQERLTKEIANAVYEVTGAKAVLVVMNAKHMCMMMRGVEKECDTYTKSFVGNISNDQKRELLDMINK
ncbi:GTP cyclohydrolase I FolE [Gallintestinimicrobium propionicum]|uniref:GTP cyclohydrolase 1 n=1 Tax=Gallintestinimicrobium propionicum TaxID=2981770 RepID=A0AAE3AXM8_9FIRM|nr:GTP cyclohydrolase I FolE [Gallintestinimicrobium propionicum]MCC2168656.1 GTP cyclohydrolase I FolE [Gallintestinimicrobium propionicum]